MTRTMFALVASPALGIAVCLCSCTTVQEPEFLDPEATIVGMAFQQVTLLETTALFTIRLSNENAFPLTVDGSVYKIGVNGSRLGTGMSDEVVELPRLSTATIRVPVHIRNLRMAFGARDVMGSGSVDYEMSSVLHLTGTASRRVQTSSEGTFVLPQSQRQSLAPFLVAPTPLLAP